MKILKCFSPDFAKIQINTENTIYFSKVPMNKLGNQEMKVKYFTLKTFRIQNINTTLLNVIIKMYNKIHNLDSRINF